MPQNNHKPSRYNAVRFIFKYAKLNLQLMSASIIIIIDIFKVA